MNTYKISVTGCIVLYKNDEKVLLDAVNSFLNSSIDVKLYIIDNSPTNDLAVLFSSREIDYIHNPTNPGFGASHNIAIKKAMADGSDYHLVLNPDVSFDGNLLAVIRDYMNQNLDVGNLMPKVLYPDGSLQYLCKLLPTPYDWIGRRFNPSRFLVDKRNEIFELRFTGYNKIMDVPYLSGCFMFLRLSCLKEIGLFDDRIFMYGEETDLCRRLIAKQYRTVFYPDVSIVHHFEKGSHKSWSLTWIGIQSAIYYFNKWGWFFDKERKKINQQVLRRLGH
ncbi:glycosyltransferase family 2 protein [Pedobacter sp. PWIIR3]